jgi:hypothetical protein
MMRIRDALPQQVVGLNNRYLFQKQFPLDINRNNIMFPIQARRVYNNPVLVDMGRAETLYPNQVLSRLIHYYAPNRPDKYEVIFDSIVEEIGYDAGIGFLRAIYNRSVGEKIDKQVRERIIAYINKNVDKERGALIERQLVRTKSTTTTRGGGLRRAPKRGHRSIRISIPSVAFQDFLAHGYIYEFAPHSILRCSHCTLVSKNASHFLSFQIHDVIELHFSL